MITVEIYVSGIVQGVGYRYFTENIAEQLGINGYVKNLSDGRVYAIAQGEESKITKFIEFLWQGPFGADVSDVSFKKIETKEVFKNFSIRF